MRWVAGAPGAKAVAALPNGVAAFSNKGGDPWRLVKTIYAWNRSRQLRGLYAAVTRNEFEEAKQGFFPRQKLTMDQPSRLTHGFRFCGIRGRRKKVRLMPGDAGGILWC